MFAQEAPSPTISVILSTRHVPLHAEKDLPDSFRTEDDGDYVLLSLIADDAEDSRLCVQKTTEALKKMKIVSRFVDGVVKDTKTIGDAIDNTEKVVNSVEAFINRWEFVRDRLRFIVDALEPIPEVCSIFAVNSFRNNIFPRFFALQSWRGMSFHIYLKYDPSFVFLNLTEF